MLERGGKVYLDSNAIIEAHRTKCWKALANEFELHTVTRCQQEVLAGKRGKGHVEVEADSLKNRITIHHVEQRRVVAFSLEIEGQLFDVDGGERELLAHALQDPDAWFLCGPDNASMHALNFFRQLNRAISLEAMCRAGKIQTAQQFKNNYTERWLSDFRMKNQLLP